MGCDDAIAVSIDMSSGTGVTMWIWQDDSIKTSVLVDNNTLLLGGDTGGDLLGKAVYRYTHNYNFKKRIY